jgi:hypothetical protein
MSVSRVLRRIDGALHKEPEGGVGDDAICSHRSGAVLLSFFISVVITAALTLPHRQRRLQLHQVLRQALAIVLMLDLYDAQYVSRTIFSKSLDSIVDLAMSMSASKRSQVRVLARH